MAYKKVAKGQFEPLDKPSIDHGSGLERIAAAVNGKISLLWPIIEKLQNLSGKSYASHTESMQVIADHLRELRRLWRLMGACQVIKETGAM